MTLLNNQRGSTLLVALVMLMLLTLVAISAMNASTTSIQVVGNAQFREEANNAAQQAIEGVISNNFTANPVSSVVTVNVGGTDYVAAVAVPTCKNTVPLINSELDTNNPEDAVCLSSGSLQNTGVMNASGVLSTTQPWCYQQTWEVNATVNDSDTGASTSVHQGVSLRVPAGTDCP
ncbi:MAG: PilX N-terminal domain-containing pilus assembly protein [Candidatus Nitrotoga sp.]|nr:PilX N-terminal domain-containing pilus assembly protein [Candidatus Nitrotoga sp.]MDP1856936.1 PilX N-terminal domain-containing pilus assembly protein [Candidatus Nitrotoga sp.]